MLPASGGTERRRTGSTRPEIKSLEDARQLVQNINARKVENNSRVKAWRFAKQTAWLFLLVVLFLVYYLLDMAYRAVSLP